MNNNVSLGKTGIQISQIGVGTWAWGDKAVWGYGQGYSDSEIENAFDESIRANLTFYDTAEIYGRGRSERFLGRFVREKNTRVVVASKFFPFPWRLTEASVLKALRASLDRLSLASIDLYQIHWPLHVISIERLMEALANAKEEELIHSIGVSNYNADQMRRAYDALAKRNISLASNQVEYSLLQRKPERNGVLAVCRKLGVTLIAYSPLAMGMLTGKYTKDNRPGGYRGQRYRSVLPRLSNLLNVLREIGRSRGGKTASQVALNWLICKEVVPIPGAKNAQQARENAGSVGWRLTNAEVARLDEASQSMQKKGQT